MLSSSVSDVRETKAYCISLRTPRFASGAGIREGPLSVCPRSPVKRPSYCLVTKSMATQPQPGDNSGCCHKTATIAGQVGNSPARIVQ